MADIHWLVDRIERGPQGPGVTAFFDFDGTVIDGYSASAFFRARLKARDIDAQELLNTLIEGVNVERRGHDVDRLMEIAVGSQQGKSIEEMTRFARRMFNTKISGMIYPDARELIHAHKRAGHSVVIASSATRPQVQPAAEDLEVDDVLVTEMQTDNDLFTGMLSSPVRWGEEKAAAVIEWAEASDIDLADCYAYSNGGEDVPFLEVVGSPCALNPDDDLKQIAIDNDWPIANFSMPHRHNPLTLARSAAALGSLGFGFAAGVTTAVLNRNRAAGAGVGATVGSELALAIAGIELRVVGEENLWSDRPAVFLFNHQSQLDVVVLGALLRRDFTGVAKKQLEHDPFFGPIGYLTEVAYVDRKNREKAIEALEPVVEALRNGKSIAISPEGTRSPTPRLLPFKKGPFHMAMQAGVPIVPIVMRNCGDLMRPHSLVISNGICDVAVLPPVQTSGWKVERMDDYVKQVRDMYIDTLENWPTQV